MLSQPGRHISPGQEAANQTKQPSSQPEAPEPSAARWNFYFAPRMHCEPLRIPWALWPGISVGGQPTRQPSSQRRQRPAEIPGPGAHGILSGSQCILGAKQKFQPTGPKSNGLEPKRLRTSIHPSLMGRPPVHTDLSLSLSLSQIEDLLVLQISAEME